MKRADGQNSTVVLRLKFSNKANFCASVSRPNSKPQNVSSNKKAANIRERIAHSAFNDVAAVFEEILRDCENIA